MRDDQENSASEIFISKHRESLVDRASSMLNTFKHSHKRKDEDGVSQEVNYNTNPN
jgi:hypothetical protein